VYLDGYAVIRLADVVEIIDKSHGIEARSLAVLDDSPIISSEMSLDSWSSLMSSLGMSRPICVYDEITNGNVCWIGLVTSLDSELMMLREISTEAEWFSDPTRWAIEKITRIDYGVRYETALKTVAGDPPSA
jgi:hypothetical protein